MLNINKFVFLILLIVICFVLFFIFKTDEIETIQERDIIAWTVASTTAKEFKQKYNLNIIAFGLSTDNKLLKTIELSFSLDRVLTKEEGRILILTCIEGFLDKINTFEEIQPFLSNHPFTEKNIEIRIFLYKDQKYTKILHPDICSISFANGVISFDTKELLPPHRYKSTEKESLEEAQRIVQTSGLAT